MTRHQEHEKTECTDKTWFDVDETELGIPQFRRRLQQPPGCPTDGASSHLMSSSFRVQICNATRVIVTWDVASVTNLIIYADILAGDTLAGEVSQEREERAVSGEKA